VVEIDEQWIPVIRRRLDTEGAQGSLFGAADGDPTGEQLGLL
jgi:hypothetical protein